MVLLKCPSDSHLQSRLRATAFVQQRGLDNGERVRGRSEGRRMNLCVVDEKRVPWNWLWETWGQEVLKAETWMVSGGRVLFPRLCSGMCKSLERESLWDACAGGASWGDPESSTVDMTTRMPQRALKIIGTSRLHGDLCVPWAKDPTAPFLPTA